MLGIIIIVTSFGIATFGFINDNKAKAQDKKYIGLTRTGLILISIATIGLIAGVSKEINSMNDAKKLKNEREELIQIVKESNAMLKGLSNSIEDPEIKADLSKVTNKLETSHQILRESNFSMADLSDSDFSSAMFRDVNFYNTAFDFSDFSHTRFRGAKFYLADFSGVDLSNIKYDESTIFPNQ